MAKHISAARLLACLLAIASLAGCAGREVLQVRQMVISPVDLAGVRDGDFQGDYTYGGFTYVVSVAVRNHEISHIDVLENRSTRPAKAAEGVVPRILETQRNNVDAVSGATTTSKALLKAIENALLKGRQP